MELLVTGDPMTFSYWLNWRVLICAIWVVGSMVIGLYLIWKYEHPDDPAYNGVRRQQESFLSLHYEESWKPCLRGLHPLYLMFFRIIAFFLLLVAISFDVALHGFELFYYYTQWTFTLVTIYFGLGSLLSMHGCFHHMKMSSSSKVYLVKDMEQGLYTPLAYVVNENGVKLSGKKVKDGKFHALLTSGFWGFVHQILFQIIAGAVTITDVIYWSVIFPFLTLRDYEMNFTTVVAHSLNAIMLLGDTALNRLQFPWFRICYFLLFTGIYVIFQWIVHASVRIWWPYPFLDLSLDMAPFWYMIVALMHVPCYAIYALVVKGKHSLYSRLLPQSYQCRA